MLRLLLFPVSVEAPHFRRSFWKTAVRKLKRGIQRALVEIRSSANERRPCARRRPPRSIEPAPPIGESPIPRRLQNLQISSAPKLRAVLDPHRKIDSPNFCPTNWAQKAVGPAQSSRQAAERLVCTLTRVAVFRKKMSFFVQRGNTPQAASCERPRMGFGNRMKKRLIHPRERRRGCRLARRAASGEGVSDPRGSTSDRLGYFPALPSEPVD